MGGPCSVPGSRARSRMLWRIALVVALIALVALALATMMLTRPYLGERAIARLRLRSPPRRRAAAGSGVRPRPRASVARGGRLIAAALAGRAPPRALAGHS